MAKKNPTLNYFSLPKGFDGAMHVPGPNPGDIPENRRAIYRLGWNPHEGLLNWAGLAKMVSGSALPEMTFFLDSSFIDRHEIPVEMTSALLSRKIGITPFVWEELKNHFRANPIANRSFCELLVAAKQNGHDSVLFLEPSSWGKEIEASARYYIELLAARKQIGQVEIDRFERKCGRKPTEGELIGILQSIVRERGLLLARKGLTDFEKPTFLADEELVVCAIFHALLTGHETHLLTRDLDLLEQFYKAIYLIDTHYRSMLIGDQICAAPQNLLRQTLPHDVGFKACFDGGEIEAFMLPRHFMDWVLPAERHWVCVTCSRLVGHGEQMKLVGMSFCAETEMSRLLHHKGTSGGLNTLALNGTNLHIMISPPFPKGMSGDAISGRDRRFRIGSTEFPVVDLEYSLKEVEHFHHLQVLDEFVAPTSISLPDLGGLREDKRLTFCAPNRWLDAPHSQLTTLIRAFDPAAIFFADHTFIDSIHGNTFWEPLLDREIATTAHVRGYLAHRSTRLSRLANEVVRGSKGVRFDDTIPGFAYEWGYGYYLALLAFRKLFCTVIKNQVKREHGRESPDTEWPLIVEHFSGNRGRRLAEDGWRRENDPSLFFGEEILIQGLIASINHGTDVVFLTCDPLVLEQFVKLGRFVREQYLACEFARKFVADPTGFHTYTVARSGGAVDQLIKGSMQCHELAADWQDKILPANPYKLHLHCWLFGASQEEAVRLAPVKFCAERPMHEMLTIKGKTGGLNSDGLSGKNIMISNVPTSTGLGASSLIFNETMIPVDSHDFPADPRLDLRITSLPFSDLVTAINNDEPVSGFWLQD